jgi:xanthine dehydrogenase YagR molybdenum-binding subunit
MLQLIVNGLRRDVDEGVHERLVDALRLGLRLTGTKEVCSTGACGACTVLADGVPVVSCLLPTRAAAGRSIETVEGIGPALHPVQKALMAHDGLQCGFCTPGFVMQGVAFFKQWRGRNGAVPPSRQDVGEALSGHLCRCGAYVGIIDALIAACAGDFDADDEPQCPRHDARHKVTGEARFTVDVYPPDVLEGAILRSVHAHARVRRVSLERALQAPGVRAAVVLLGANPSAWEVRYVGQEIAAVAAVDVQAARNALPLIDVEYEPLASAVGAAAARAPGAPAVYSIFGPPSASESELPLIPEPYHHNLHGPFFFFSHRPLRAAATLDEARHAQDPYLVEQTWRTQGQSHTPLEPHAAVAEWTTPEALRVHLSTQACADMATDIAEHFDLDPAHVQVLSPYVGGGFGGKSELTQEAIAAIELARQAHTPVRVVLTRSEELTVGGYRPGVEIKTALVSDAKGRLRALSMHATADGGVAVGSTVAGLCRFTFPDAKKVLIDYDVLSHCAPGKPFRGPGGPPACWALERSITQLTSRIGIDAVTLRQRNTGIGTQTQLCEWVTALEAWQGRERRRVTTGRMRRGFGLAFGAWGYFVQPQSTVQVNSSPHGLTVSSASQDMGTGTRSVMADAVGWVFGVPPATVHVHLGDSTFARGPISSGSRTTASIRPASLTAATRLRESLVQSAARDLGLTDVRTVPGGLSHRDGNIPWQTVFEKLAPHQATAGRRRDRVPFVLPFSLGQFQIGRGRTASVHLVEVEVDTSMGQTRVVRLWAAFAVGNIAALPLARSQVYGGAIQGLGYALYEERVIDPTTGATLTMSLDDYRLPGIGDVPEMNVEFLEGGFDYVEGGAVGIGEIATIAVAAAIGNAVADATGWQPTELPMRPDRLLDALGVHP